MLTELNQGLGFGGLAGQVTQRRFSVADISDEILTKLRTARYAWLTTVAGSGIPVPMLMWFRFDGRALIVYSEPDAARVTHVSEHPQVALHLESDGVGSGLLAFGGNAAVTAEGVDPRDDHEFWAKYHLEAELTGVGEEIRRCSSRITITPATIWTTLPI